MMKIEDSLVVFIDFQEKLMPAMHNKEILENRVIRFAQGMGVLGIPAIVTQQYTKGLGETVPAIAEAIGDFQPIEKTCFGCMGNVEFVNQIELAEKKNIIVCGIESHICLQQTVLQLLAEGYNVCVPVDCISSRSQIDYLWAVERMERAGAIMTTYESILYELMVDSKHEGFKAISKIVK